MKRAFARSTPLALVLLVVSIIPVTMAAVRAVQIPLDALPQDSLRLATNPATLFVHSIAGVLFGVLGPLQFVRVLRHRLGATHRVAGRVFGLAGAGLALSGLALLLQVESIATELLDTARGVFGAALIAALLLAMKAIRARDMHGHRDWMIRSYALGMGTGTVAPVMFPIYLITGEPPMGLTVDVATVGMWLLSIAVAEWLVRRLRRNAET